MKWNKVSDSFPNSSIDVLITDGESVAVAHNSDLGYWVPSNIETYPLHEPLAFPFDIKYWAELPELPKL